MKSALLLMAFLAQASTRPPDVPLANPTPDFPLHVHIIANRWGGDTVHLYRSIQGEMRGGPGYYAPSGSVHGFGIANIMGASPQGLDYTFDCPTPFMENTQPDGFYQARWKKPDMRLEILTQPVGSSRGEVCELKVALKQHPFDPEKALTAWSPANLPASAFWSDPETAFTDPDPDYPVRLHVLSSFRRYYDGGVQGYGTANLLGANPQGVDYTYDCQQGILWNTQPDEFFQGHWVKQDQRLEVLLQRPGSDRVDRCQLKVTLQPVPYPEWQSTPVATGPAPSSRPEFTKPQ